MVEKNTDLDALFEVARKDRHDLPETLSGRMLADAAEVQAGWAAIPEPFASQDIAQGRWAQLRSLLGGWTGLGGLVTACAVGIWIGLAPPAFLPDPVEIVYRQQNIDMLETGGLTDFWAEEG